MGWGAFGAGFFGALNKDAQDEKDQQIKFNDQYEQRVQAGIEAFNASRLQAGKDANTITSYANMIPGDDVPYEHKLNAAKTVYASGVDPKTVTPEYLQRFIVNQGAAPTSQQQPVPKAPSSMPPAIEGTPEGAAPATQPPAAPAHPPSTMGMTQPAIPQATPQAPPPSPVVNQPQQPQGNLPEAPTGVAQPGWRGQASHLLFSTPLPGQRENIAATRSGSMNNMSPEQAAGMAGYHTSAPSYQVQPGSMRQAPSLEQSQKLMENQAPGADMNHIATALQHGDTGPALANLDSLTSRKLAEADARSAGTAAAAEIRANGLMAGNLIRSVPALVNGMNLPQDQANQLIHTLTQQYYGMVGASNPYPAPVPQLPGGPPTAVPNAAGPQGNAPVRPPGSRPVLTGPNAGKYKTPDGRYIP